MPDLPGALVRRTEGEDIRTSSNQGVRARSREVHALRTGRFGWICTSGVSGSPKVQEEGAPACRASCCEPRALQVHRRVERAPFPHNLGAANDRPPIGERVSTQAAEVVADALQPALAVDLREVRCATRRQHCDVGDGIAARVPLQMRELWREGRAKPELGWGLWIHERAVQAIGRQGRAGAGNTASVPASDFLLSLGC